MSTPAQLVWTKQAILHEWTPDQLRKAMAVPEELQKLTELINAPDEPEAPVVAAPPELTAEQKAEADAAAAAQAAEQAAAQEREREAQAAKALADQAAAEEEAQYRQAGVRVIKDANGSITKIIKEYQAKDEKGNPIGRPTHLEARSWLELTVKQQQAHENAIRFAERIQKQRITFKQPKPGLTDDEILKLQETLVSEDREAANAAAAKLRDNAKVRQPADLDEEKRKVTESQIAYKWMTDHLTDFYPCQANSDILKGYIEDNNLEFTYDNLEAAYSAVELRLVQRPAPAAPAPVNPEPVAQPTAQPVAAPAAAAPAVAPAAAPQPAAAAPAAPAEQPNAEPPARRPGVNGGIVPGSNSGVRPSATAQPVGLQWEEIKKWSGKQLRDEMKKSPQRRAEIERVIASRPRK